MLPLLKPCLAEVSSSQNSNNYTIKISRLNTHTIPKLQTPQTLKPLISDSKALIKDLVLKIANNLLAHDFTLMDVIHSRIYDKVIDGKEYQLIRRSDFVDIMNNIGVNFSVDEHLVLANIIPLVLSDL